MLRFAQADIHDIAPAILDAIVTKTKEAGSPEMVAENGCLIKCTSCLLCLARSCEIANDVFVFKAHTSRYGPLIPTPSYERTQQCLVSTLCAISKNPSNSIFENIL